MTDQPFLSWSFSGRRPDDAFGGNADRPIGDRISDIYNVKDYGADGTLGNDLTAIQAAVNDACLYGGTVFFPPGGYHLSGRIVVPSNVNAAITFLGCGGQGGKGSQISMAVRDYIIYCEHGPVAGGGAGTTVKLIQGLNFHHEYDGAAPTSTEPDTTSDGTDGDGCGCIYMSGGTGNVIRDCEFQLSTGIAIFYHGFQGCIENINITGSYVDNSDVNKTIGILTRSSNIRNGKFTSLGTGICAIKGPSMIEFVDVEVSGIGMRFGVTPVEYWESNNQDLVAAGTSIPLSRGCFVNHVGLESCSETFLWCQNVSGIFQMVTLDGFSQVGVASYGLRCDGAFGCYFQVNVSGAFSVAAIDANTVSGSLFKGCQPSNSGTGSSGVEWILPTGFSSPSTGAFWDQCNTTGAVAFSARPTLVSVISGPFMAFSDSVDAAWSGSVSNVGKPITGGGSKEVIARWSVVQKLAATASWTTSTPNITMTSNPGTVTAGMGVYDLTTGLRVGVVSTFVGTALVLTANAESASSGAADNLAFSAWTIAG